MVFAFGFKYAISETHDATPAFENAITDFVFEYAIMEKHDAGTASELATLESVCVVRNASFMTKCWQRSPSPC